MEGFYACVRGRIPRSAGLPWKETKRLLEFELEFEHSRHKQSRPGDASWLPKKISKQAIPYI